MTLFDELLREAKAGNTQAQMEVAEAYFKGIYVIKNYNEALYWLEKASDNNKYAPMQMTNMYRNGIGVKKDLKKAFDIASRVAKANASMIQYVSDKVLTEEFGCVKDENYNKKTVKNKDRITVNNFAMTHPYGTYILHVRQHQVTVKDGEKVNTITNTLTIKTNARHFVSVVQSICLKLG